MIYETTKWRKKREKILRRDGYKCQLCYRYGKQTTATTVHHILPYGEAPNLGFEDYNLISICKVCHGKMHDRTGEKLSKEGIELLQRTFRKYNKQIPNQYRS